MRPIEMKCAAVIALTWCLVASAACSDPSSAERRAAFDAAPTPVLVELFTSEGCSSCPPADDLLAELVAVQPIPEVQIIGLGEHVDYWNSLGWFDRFSAPKFTRRQSTYQQHVFADSVVYTPQVVIDGRFEAVGSRAGAVHRAIVEAARSPKGKVDVVAYPPNDGKARLEVTIGIDDTVERTGSAAVYVAAIESGLTTDVERGENRGRTLMHSAVVRSLHSIHTIGAEQPALAFTASIPIGNDWDGENLRFVVFVQEEQSRRVLAAVSATVPDRE